MVHFTVTYTAIRVKLVHHRAWHPARPRVEERASVLHLLAGAA